MTEENLFIDLPPIMSWKERGKFDYWIYEGHSFELDENIAWTCLIFGVIHVDSGIIKEFLPHTQILYTVQVVDCKLASKRLSKPSVPRSIPKHASLRGGLSPNVSTIKPYGQEWITGHK